jgi:predicted short-subunit dehydrogenase-like oxidoreductase (DUF2520 family)
MAARMQPLGLIGDGRLARHLAHYFLLLDLPVKRWSRRMSGESLSTLFSTLRDCPVILLAVSDRAIETLASEIRSAQGFEDRTLIHFSGALFTDKAWGFHPLMSFAGPLYSLEQYEKIPFLIDQNAPDFSKVFPKLRNPSARIACEQKALYHAWCVMGGNFTAFLWTRMFETFAAELGIDPALATPYLRQVTENLLKNPKAGRDTWTGPIVRNDQKTIDANLGALDGDSYQAIYRAFLKAHSLSDERTTS